MMTSLVGYTNVLREATHRHLNGISGKNERNKSV